MYTDLQIQQAIATVQAKLTTQAYSRYLKDLYGSSEDYCLCNEIACLLLFRFALLSWNNLPGATNFYTTVGLNNIIKRINAL
jgi:hypothetical protein